MRAQKQQYYAIIWHTHQTLFFFDKHIMCHTSRGGRKKLDASRFFLQRFWIDSGNFRIGYEASF